MFCLQYNITKYSCNSKMASKSQLYHYNSTLDCLAELQLCQQPCRSPFYGMLSPLITLSPFVALPFPGILILVPKLCCYRGFVQCTQCTTFFNLILHTIRTITYFISLHTSIKLKGTMV